MSFGEEKYVPSIATNSAGTADFKHHVATIERLTAENAKLLSERDKLQSQLDQVTTQRDNLVKASKPVVEWARDQFLTTSDHGMMWHFKSAIAASEEIQP